MNIEVKSFRIKGPALISFSGGRSSAFMLHEIVKAYDGTLPSDVVVTFANTGRELPETLDFVRNCSERLAPVVWLEFCDAVEPSMRWKITDYGRAGRHGEPFDAMLARKKYLPNVVARFCTTELKIRPMKGFALSLGWEHWTNVVGLRADEQRRVANLKDSEARDRWDIEVPLYRAGVTKRDVAAFWRSQNWDLELPSVKGSTPLGNCDCCFLKGEATIAGIMRQRPGVGEWWARKERETGKTWSKRFSHASLQRIASGPDLLDFLPNSQRGSCICNGDS